MNNTKIVKRIRRKKHIRKDISGTELRPRLSVFRSNVHIYAQLIDDESKKTIAAASDIKVKSGSKQDRAKKVGADIAKAAIAGKITDVVFDRNGYRYHGRIKILADSAREAGLKF
jgi:large subunit ribosomal protein L18